MADRYWVGGSGNWDAGSTTHWSATSGGPSGASAPGAADNAFFNSASASGDYTVTLTGGFCGDLNLAKPTGGTLTFAGIANTTCSGNLNIVADGVIWTHSAQIQFTLGSSGILSRTINTDGLTLASDIYFNAVGVTWQLQTSMTSSKSIAIANGILDLNNFDWVGPTCNAGGGSVKTIAFGTSGRIVLTGNSATVWNNAIANGFLFTGNCNITLNYSGSTGTRTIAQGSTVSAAAANVPNFYITAGADTVVVTLQAGNLDFTGFTGTLSNSARTIYGNLVISSGMTVASGTSATTFGATSGTKTITTNGATIDFPITFNGIGGTFQFSDNYTGGTTATSILTLTNGTLDLNGKTISIYAVATSGSTTRNLVGNSGIINVFGGNATVWNSATVTNATFNNVNVNFTYSSNIGNRTISPGSVLEANSINFNITAGTDNIILNGSCRDLNFTGFSGNLNATTRTVFGNLIYSPTMNVVASSGVTTTLGATSGTKIIDTYGIDVINSFTVAANGGTYQLANNLNAWDGSAGTLFTLSVGNLDLNDKTLTTGLYSGSGSAVRSINFGNSGIINLAFSNATIWSVANATNFTYIGNGIVNLTANSSSGPRNIVHGSGAGSFPTNLPPKFNIVAGTDNVVTALNSNLSSLDFTGFSGNLTNTARYIHGNLTLAPTMTLIAGANITIFSGNGTQYYESAGLLNDFPVTVGNGTSTGTMVLANTLTLGNTRIFNAASGTFNANGYNLTAGTFASTNSNPRQVNISNTTVTLNAGGGSIWNCFIPSNLTLNAANSNIVIANPSGNPTLYLGNAVVYDNIVLAGAGIPTFNPNGNVTINSLTSTQTGNRTFVFNGNASSYTTVNNWNIVGDAGNTVSITSDNGTPFNLVYGGNSTVNVSYHTISYSSASPADTWYALTTNNNANGGNNTGWIFTLPPVTSSNFFLVF